MHSFSCLPRTDSRALHKESERPADRRHARKFQDLLDAPPDTLAAGAVLSAPLTLPTLSGLDGNDRAEGASARSTAPAGGYAGATPAMPAVVNDQTLTLRASTGPLAGLLVQAEWRNQRLSLRLSAPDGVLAACLARQQRQLQTVLSAALGVDIIVDVQHANQ